VKWRNIKVHVRFSPINSLRYLTFSSVCAVFSRPLPYIPLLTRAHQPVYRLLSLSKATNPFYRPSEMRLLYFSTVGFLFIYFFFQSPSRLDLTSDCHNQYQYRKVVDRECKPGPFFPNPGFGFPGIPGLQKPGFRVCDHETRVSGLRYRELKLSNIMNEQLNF